MAYGFEMSKTQPADTRRKNNLNGPAPTPISKEEDAYRRIKDFMYRREFAPGQKIIYRDLEELLGMSKTPIVSALARLEQEGFVVSEHNRGYYVKKLSKSEIKQLYELRIRLEEISVEYALEQIESPAALEDLKASLDAYLEYDNPLYDSARLQLDLNFHLQIARLGENKFLISVLMQLYEQARIGLPAVFMSSLIPRFKQDHIHIYQALEVGDGDQAKRLIRRHEMSTLELLEQMG